MWSVLGIKLQDDLDRWSLDQDGHPRALGKHRHVKSCADSGVFRGFAPFPRCFRLKLGRDPLCPPRSPEKESRDFDPEVMQWSKQKSPRFVAERPSNPVGEPSEEFPMNCHLVNGFKMI